ncbi:MAG: tetratricopeptide repeat protein [Burkholderiaceae bacterium]
MRSADRLRTHLAPLLAAWVLAGCASMAEPMQFVRDTAAKVADAVAPAPAASAASAPEPARVAAAAPSASAPIVAPVAAPVAVESPVDAQAQAAFDQARRALRAGRTDEAERGFRALADKHPELGGAHANLGVIYRQAGKMPEAVAAMEKAVKASPKQAVFHNQLGITYRHAGQFTKAKEAYERAIELDPNYASPYLNLGILSDLYLRDNQRALEMYMRFLVLSPGGDATVTKWVAEIKNRKPDQVLVSHKERE